MDKDLKKEVGKHISKSMSKKQLLKLVAVLMVVELTVIVVLLLVYASLKLQMETLNNRVSYLSDNTDVMIKDIKALKNDFDETLQEESSLLESWEIKMQDLDFGSNTYRVSISLVPKEYSSETLTYIYFGVTEYQLELKGFKYVGEVDLPIDESYEGNVTVLFVNGNQRSTEVLSNYDGIVNDFDSVISGTLANMPAYADGLLNFDAECIYNLNGNDTFEFISFDMDVYVDGHSVASYDLLHESDVNLFNTETDELPDGVSIGELEDVDSGSQGKEYDREKTTEEAVPQKTDNKETMSRISGRFDNSESFEAKAGDSVRVCLLAVTKEGYVFSYDLFNGVIASEDMPEEEVTQEGFVDSDEFFKVYSSVYDNKGGKYIIE